MTLGGRVGVGMRFGPQLEVTGDAVHACVTLDGTLHAEMTAHADVFVKDWDFALLSGDFFKKELYSNCPRSVGPAWAWKWWFQRWRWRRQRRAPAAGEQPVVGPEHAGA